MKFKFDGIRLIRGFLGMRQYANIRNIITFLEYIISRWTIYNIILYYYLDSSDIIWYIFLYRKILHTNQSYSKYIFPSFETISFHLRFRAKFQNQSWPGESSSAHIYIKCINKQVPSMVCWPLMFPKYLPLRRNIVHLHPRHGSSPSSPRPVRMFAHQDPASAI